MMKLFPLTIAVALTFGSAALAAPGHTKIKAATQAVLVCPVTGEKIASIKDAEGSSTYKGKDLLFLLRKLQTGVR